jgi:hypothetical protein
MTPRWCSVFLAGALAALGAAGAAPPANPVVRHLFTADPTAKVFGDRIYLYTSHDEADAKYFDMFDWRLFSTTDLATWQDHGSIFHLKGFAWAKQYAWAPDAIAANGKYYLFLPVDRNKIGVAVADSPTGPFKDAIGAPLIDYATMPEAGREPIDPALFTDDDGSTWLYFGCRQPMVVKLDPALTKLAGPLQPVVLLDPAGHPIPQALPEKQPALPMGYGEAPFVFKRGGKYYYVYANGWAKESTLVYARGDSPAGPFTYAGPVMHRAASVTQHGSIVPFRGRWYLFYHTSDIPGGNTFRRAVCVDELTFAPDGRIIPVTPTPPYAPTVDGLKVSGNRRYLVNARTGAPFFLLADTAWNLGALRLEEIDRYLQSRAEHGFNTVMFALNFAPQAEAKNAYGQPAYLGADRTELNPAYFEYCDAIVRAAATRGLYVMIYAMWAGEKAGTMNRYTAGQLDTLGRALGRHFAGVPNVILCAGGEATPHYIEEARVHALGAALKEGCAGRNLVTVHPVSPHSTSRFYAGSSWLDFYMSQGKSGNNPATALFDAAALVLGDWELPESAIKPTMMVEHRYESGTQEDPLIQRRSLYQCVFAGAFGYGYGHNALWQMTPHTAQPWMLKGWSPGVAHWGEALDTPAVRQLRHIVALLGSFPFLRLIPDQGLVIEGQGSDVTGRVQVTRDGSQGRNDATYVLAYVSSPREVILDTRVIAAPRLQVRWFDPQTGRTEADGDVRPNPGRLVLEKRPHGTDWVAIIEGVPAPSASRADHQSGAP